MHNLYRFVRIYLTDSEFWQNFIYRILAKKDGDFFQLSLLISRVQMCSNLTFSSISKHQLMINEGLITAPHWYVVKSLKSIRILNSDKFCLQVCLHNLRKTFKYGGRKNVPSIEEITAISAGRNSKRQIYR